MWWRAIVVLQVLQQFPTVSSQNYGNYYTTFAEYDYYCTYTHVNYLHAIYDLAYLRYRVYSLGLYCPPRSLHPERFLIFILFVQCVTVHS